MTLGHSLIPRSLARRRVGIREVVKCDSAVATMVAPSRNPSVPREVDTAVVIDIRRVGIRNIPVCRSAVATVCIMRRVGIRSIVYIPRSWISNAVSEYASAYL